MKRFLTVVTLALLFISCSDDNNESAPSLLHKWYFNTVTVNGVTSVEEADGCDRDYMEFTEDLWQITIYSKNDLNECAVTSSIGEYEVINSQIQGTSSSSPSYEIISLSDDELVLHYLIPSDINNDGNLDDVTYTFSRT
jgi:hypothetical protein